jgi:hypothetical protein
MLQGISGDPCGEWEGKLPGHRTMRPRLRWGWMSCPMPKFFDRFSMSGFFAGFFDPAPALPCGKG